MLALLPWQGFSCFFGYLFKCPLVCCVRLFDDHLPVIVIIVLDSTVSKCFFGFVLSLKHSQALWDRSTFDVKEVLLPLLRRVLWPDGGPHRHKLVTWLATSWCHFPWSSSRLRLIFLIFSLSFALHKENVNWCLITAPWVVSREKPPLVFLLVQSPVGRVPGWSHTSSVSTLGDPY